MKFRLLIVLLSLFCFAASGCQESAKLPESSEPGEVSVFVEGGGEFPAELAGNWKSNREEWGFVFEKDGRISRARIATGRKLVTPGEVNYGETKRGGRKGIFEGTVAFDGLKEQGDYEVRLYFNNSFNLEAVHSFSVGKETTIPNPPAKPGVPFVKTNKRSYATGEEIEVEFNNASGEPLDWVGLYKKVAEGNEPSAADWFHTDGRKLGESRYVPGDWIVTYSPQSREIDQVTIFARKGAVSTVTSPPCH